MTPVRATARSIASRNDAQQTCLHGAPVVRRMRPALGTFVELRVEGMTQPRGMRAVEQAFAEIAAVHRLMSFHEGGSDLSRLHRARRGETVTVDRRTHAVLACAMEIAHASAGCFDPTVAAQQVAWGLLPRPGGARLPQSGANWRDIELVGTRRVRLRRRVWIDLGGIAKGYAVDRALEILAAAGAVQACVNAGGDLRVAGERAETVNLRRHAGIDALPAVELAGAALATSAGRAGGARMPQAHVDGRTRRAVGAGRVAVVVAAHCAVADALTKVVMAGSDAFAARVLRRFGAQARIYGAGVAMPRAVA